MADVVANSLSANASVAWTLQETLAPFAALKQGPDSLALRLTPDTATFNVMLLRSFTVAPAATVSVNFASFLDLLNNTQTCTKVSGFFVKATGNGGQMKLTPGGSNPMTWFWGGTSPTITLTCGANGCGLWLMDGSAATIGAPTGTMDVNNPGGSTITVTIAGIVGA